MVNRSIALALTGLLAGVVTTGCTHGANAGSAPRPADLNEVCAIRPTEVPMSVDDFTALVRRLNAALTHALAGKLPDDTRITNNLYSSATGKQLGGAEMIFVPRRGDTGGIDFEASLLITSSAAVATGRVMVGRYSAVPDKAPCLKGATVLRCDRTVGPDGTVLMVVDQTTAQGPQTVGHDIVVQCYRPGGVTVMATFSAYPVNRRSPPPGEVPSLLTLDEILAVVADPALTL